MAKLAVLFFLTLFSFHFVHPKQINASNLDKFRNVVRSEHSIGDILDYIKQLVKSAKDMISNIADSLGDLASDFKEQITEAISNIPITILINQLKKEIASIVSQGGAVAQRCAKEADAQILQLTTKSNSAMQECKDTAYSVLTQFTDDMKRFADRASDLLDQFIADVASCMRNNTLNPIDLVKCLQTTVKTFTENINDIQQQVETTIENAKSTMKETVLDLAACMNKVQMKTIKSGQKILAQTEKCVAGK